MSNLLRKLAFLLMSLGVIGCQVITPCAHADIVSLESNFVPGEADVVGHLNRDRNALTDGVNNVLGVFAGVVQSSGQIKGQTIGEENMAADANSRIRTAESAACPYVYTGLNISTTVSTLIGSIPSGTAYPVGYRIAKSSSTAHTFTASKYTWIDLDKNGNFNYLEQAIGTSAPAVTANSLRLSRVSTDSTQILAVQDLRQTTCVQGPFSSIRDVQGEGSLGDMFTYGKPWSNGLSVLPNDSTSIFVGPGTANINGFYRTITSNQTTPINQVANTAQGTSGLDTGTVAANTNYYIYAAADVASTAAMSTVFSLNGTSPSGVSNSLRIGEVSTDGTAILTSADTVGISYVGKIRQIKSRYRSNVLTGSTIIPYDNTIPQWGEGDTYITLDFTPVDANDLIEIDAGLQWATTAGTDFTMALFQDTGPNALAAINAPWPGTANYPQFSVMKYRVVAGSTSKRTYKVNAGMEGSATVTVNGANGAAKMNGVYPSYIKVTEYQR